MKLNGNTSKRSAAARREAADFAAQERSAHRSGANRSAQSEAAARRAAAEADGQTLGIECGSCGTLVGERYFAAALAECSKLSLEHAVRAYAAVPIRELIEAREIGQRSCRCHRVTAREYLALYIGARLCEQLAQAASIRIIGLCQYFADKSKRLADLALKTAYLDRSIG